MNLFGNLGVALRMRQCRAISYALEAADLACADKGALDFITCHHLPGKQWVFLGFAFGVERSIPQCEIEVLLDAGIFLYHNPAVSIFQVGVICCLVEGIDCLTVDNHTSS